MTRDEAHTAACKAWVSNPPTGEAHISTHGLVDLFIELGMLKLDEPRSVDEVCGGLSGKVRAFMRRFHLGPYSPAQLYSALDTAGLKIVEK